MNEVMAQARNVALGILKPSPKGLEHGLELHKNSVVCDAYGFAPRAAVDGKALKAAVEGGASEAELQDMVEETTLTRYVTDPREREEFIAAWEAAGVTCIFQNAGGAGMWPPYVLKRLARFLYVTDAMRDFIRKAATPEDIVLAKKEGRRCLYMSSNGVPLPEGWVSVEEELRYIRIGFQLGFRMMHLTYNRRNMIGDGCAEPANGGLSDFGRAVVAEMNRVGVIVDVAHSSWQTSLDAARASNRPMVASHSGCCAVNKHIRCKPDEVIRAICDTGGYIGVCCIPAFMGGSGDISAFLDHIEHVARTFGVDHVAIGTDVAHVPLRERREWARVPKRGRTRRRWEDFWPKDDALYDKKWQQPHMSQSLAWTNWPLFTVGLVQRGYSDADIQKILGGNVLRVARAVLRP